MAGRTPRAPKSREPAGRVYTQLGLGGIDELAPQRLVLAQVYADGCCPHIGEQSPSCVILGCPRHMAHDLRNGDATRSDDELADEILGLPYLCSLEAIRENPEGMTEESLGDALRLSRQAVQDLIRHGLSHPAWDWDELICDLAERHDPTGEMGRADLSDPKVRTACIEAIMAKVRDDMETEAAMEAQGMRWDNEGRMWV